MCLKSQFGTESKYKYQNYLGLSKRIVSHYSGAHQCYSLLIYSMNAQLPPSLPMPAKKKKVIGGHSRQVHLNSSTR